MEFKHITRSGCQVTDDQSNNKDYHEILLNIANDNRGNLSYPPIARIFNPTSERPNADAQWRFNMLITEFSAVMKVIFSEFEQERNNSQTIFCPYHEIATKSADF